MEFSGLVADQTYLIKYAFVEAIGGEWVETQGTHEVPYEGLAEYLSALAVKQKIGIDGTFQVTSLEITFVDDCPPS
jgi:hypothetical protein